MKQTVTYPRPISVAKPDTERLALLLRAVSDDGRLAIMHLLTHGEHCVCEIVEYMGAPQNLVSHHLGILRHAGLVHDRRDPDDARRVFYSLNRDCLAGLRSELASLLPLDVPPRSPAESCDSFEGRR